MAIRHGKSVVAWSAVLLTSLSLLGLSSLPSNGNSAKAEGTPTATATSTPSPSSTSRCQHWEMKADPHTEEKLMSQGVPSIASADTNDKARKAANDWFNQARTDPIVLAGSAQYFLAGEKVDPSTLSKDGCATDAAVELSTRIQLAIAGAKSITPSTAPSTGYNSSVVNNAVVGASSSGISGNRKAILITLSDGTQVWIMARCGNLVTTGPVTPPPSSPPSGCTGTSCNGTPSCTETGTCTPPTCEQQNGGKECKVAAQDPVNQGNAPVGGGRNQDPGPGTYQAPTQVTQPPSTPYTPPAPPAPTTGSSSGSGSGSTYTPDPAPAPSPEPSAPTPTDPATGCSPAPGMTSC